MKDVIKSLAQGQGHMNLPEKRAKISEFKEKKIETSPEKETKNARKKRERKEEAKKAKAVQKKHENLSDEDPLPIEQGNESDCSVESRHDAFIKSISQSINSYSLEKAS